MRSGAACLPGLVAVVARTGSLLAVCIPGTAVGRSPCFGVSDGTDLHAVVALERRMELQHRQQRAGGQHIGRVDRLGTTRLSDLWLCPAGEFRSSDLHEGESSRWSGNAVSRLSPTR